MKFRHSHGSHAVVASGQVHRSRVWRCCITKEWSTFCLLESCGRHTHHATFAEAFKEGLRHHFLHEIDDGEAALLNLTRSW